MNKKESQYARSLIEASLDPLVTLNTEGKIMDMNEATARITGKTREALTGSDFFDYFTESQKAREVYQEVFAKGFVKDYPLTIIDGNLTPVLFNGSVYKDDKGNVLGAVIVARDITEQRRIERELIEAKVFAERAALTAEEATAIAELATTIAKEATATAEEAKDKAEYAVKSKQQFLSNMSHEIRTPMNAIIGFTKVVLKTELTAKQKEYLTAVKLSGDALIVLINDILDLAKVDAGKMSFELTPFKMAASIAAMLHVFELKILEKNLNFIKEYDDRIPQILLGDSVRLHQIILNLVSNAVKFTSNGHVKVSVNLIEETPDFATIEFSVSDTGIGIPESKMNNIFENFQQASSSTARIFGGTGLGLAIVKQLVEHQGGLISVQSKVGQGSTFSFTLRFQKTDIVTELNAEILELDTETRSIKVLVVEDMALNQLLMKTLLDDFGFDRDIASNGKIAIEKLQMKSYDIILMDLQMPEMNGFEATEYIRTKLNSKIPIIALTADVTTVDLEKCKAVGMNDYIAKPVDERILYRKILGLVKKSTAFPVLKIPVKDATAPAKCTDLNYLLGRTKSNPDLMMEMITAYLDQTPGLVQAMRKGFDEKDWEVLSATIHKLIPSFAIMGINGHFETIAKKVQEFANNQQEQLEISGLIFQIESVCNQACKELEIEFYNIKNRRDEK